MHNLSIGQRILIGVVSALIPAVAFGEQPTPASVGFHIYDELSASEVEEEMTISVNHVSVGAIKLGPDKAKDVLTLTVPTATLYHYDLCGHAKVMGADGKPRMVKIDNGGDLDHLEGRALGVFSIRHIVYLLRDVTRDANSEKKQRITRNQSCPDTVAELFPNGARINFLSLWGG